MIASHDSSFRDPSGFIFIENKSIYRQINLVYKNDYDLLMKSGLYKRLAEEGLLIKHREINKGDKPSGAYKIIKPEIVPFVSYPYEWCFSQLKDAALATLKIQKIALEHGMSLKDCSAYNIQFINCKPVLIDTLSFERFSGQWVAPYRQFCRHFLAPLSLMSYVDARLNQLLRVHIDGIPLDSASKLLPFKTIFNELAYHIHLNSKLQKYFAKKKLKIKKTEMNQKQLVKLVVKLETFIKGLKWEEKTEWGDYYNITNYNSNSLRHKKAIVAKFIRSAKPKLVLDLGANNGLFSRLASDIGIPTISVDNDPAAVEANYKEAVRNSNTNLLPLVIDLTNPSSSIGWENKERLSFFERSNADTVIALALVHHLVISNNLPLRKIAEFFSRICKTLIIEFVPKNDSKVKVLLSRRKDIFYDYTKENFESSFGLYFDISDSKPIKGSKRTIYLMRRR